MSSLQLLLRAFAGATLFLDRPLMPPRRRLLLSRNRCRSRRPHDGAPLLVGRWRRLRPQSRREGALGHLRHLLLMLLPSGPLLPPPLSALQEAWCLGALCDLFADSLFVPLPLRAQLSKMIPLSPLLLLRLIILTLDLAAAQAPVSAGRIFIELLEDPGLLRAPGNFSSPLAARRKRSGTAHRTQGLCSLCGGRHISGQPTGRLGLGASCGQQRNRSGRRRQ
mmetsp:Transcript_8770/g.18699  ORF Transcript_8770/g.18699 Transcript_8770/m.18699 type:complete len:222 (-) Transcript_8770:86-751(-)